MPKKTYRRGGKKQRRSRKTRRNKRQVGGAYISILAFINNATGNQMYSYNIPTSFENIYTANNNEKINDILEKIKIARPDLKLQDKHIVSTKDEAPRLLVFMDS